MTLASSFLDLYTHTHIWKNPNKFYPDCALRRKEQKREPLQNWQRQLYPKSIISLSDVHVTVYNFSLLLKFFSLFRFINAFRGE